MVIEPGARKALLRQRYRVVEAGIKAEYKGLILARKQEIVALKKQMKEKLKKLWLTFEDDCMRHE